MEAVSSSAGERETYAWPSKVLVLARKLQESPQFGGKPLWLSAQCLLDTWFLFSFLFFPYERTNEKVFMGISPGQYSLLTSR